MYEVRFLCSKKKCLSFTLNQKHKKTLSFVRKVIRQTKFTFLKILFKIGMYVFNGQLKTEHNTRDL